MGGATDDVARPVTASVVSLGKQGSWSLFVANTMGALREFDLKGLPKATAAQIKPGRKSHAIFANKQMPMGRGYKGMMGSIRGLNVHPGGHAIAAVGLGRFAYVFETKRKAMVSKVYLKQKLNAVLMAGEVYRNPADESDADFTGDEDTDFEWEKQNKGDEEEKVEVDAIQEGFSDSEAEDDAPAKKTKKKASKGSGAQGKK